MATNLDTRVLKSMGIAKVFKEHVRTHSFPENDFFLTNDVKQLIISFADRYNHSDGFLGRWREPDH